MKMQNLNKGTIIKATVFVVLPIVLILVLFFIYRNYFFDSKFVNKTLLKKDMEFKYFTYDEFDSRKGKDDTGATYYKKGAYYLTNSGKENMSVGTILALEKARDIIEQGWNKENPSKRIVFAINSGYRSDSRNAEVGGVQNSAHRNKNGTGAKAVDIAWSKYDKPQRQAILDALKDAGFGRIGKANSFVHADNDMSLTGGQGSWVYSGYNNLV